MLHIQRGVNVNACFEQFDHVLAALRVTRAGSVGVGKFVHEGELGMARENGIEIHFGELHAAIFGVQTREGRDAFGQRIGFLATMSFDIADDDVASGGEFAAGSLKHRVGFADAGSHAEEDLQPSTLGPGILFVQGCQQDIRIGPRTIAHNLSIAIE